jgi:putative hemolysin
MVKPATFIPETATGSDVLKLFRASGDNAGIVIDENGTVEGIVTVDDILGEIAGEDLEEVVQREEGSWVVDGRLGIDELEDVIDTPLAVPEVEEDAYYTVGGFVMARLGRVPSAGESFTWGGFRFEVQEMEGNRVGVVEVSREKPPQPDAFVD